MEAKNGRKKLSLLAVFLLTVLALTLILTVVRTLALLLALDAAIGYFRSGFLPIFLYVVEGLSLAACIAFPFLINKAPVREQEPPLSTLSLVGAAACALTLTATAFYLLIKCKALAAPTVLALLGALFLAIGAAYFVMQFFPKSNSTVLLGYGMILGALMMLAVVYFDRYTQMNAPHKVAVQTATLAIMFALLFEARTALGRGGMRARIPVTAFAALLCFSVGASDLIAFLAGVYNDITYLFFDLVALCASIWFFAKCLGFLSVQEDRA